MSLQSTPLTAHVLMIVCILNSVGHNGMSLAGNIESLGRYT